MATIRLLLWTAVSAASILPSALAAQTAYARPDRSGAVASPSDPETFIPYASSRSPSTSPRYGSDSNGDPAYGPIEASPDSDPYAPNQPGRYDENQSIQGPRDLQSADDRGYASDNRSDGYDRNDQHDDGPPGDARDYGGREGSGGGVPQFSGIEQHIRDALADAVRGDLLEPDDARDMIGELRRIERQETRGSRVRGSSPSMDDDVRISDQLRQLERRAEQIRREP